MARDLDEGDLIGEAAFVFQTMVRPKKSKVPKELKGRRARAAKRLARMRIEAVVRGDPQAVVRITGGAESQHHLREHLSYITRNGKLTAEDQDGNLVSDREDIHELADDWWAGRGGKRPGWPPKESTNIVLSMPAGTDSAALLSAAREFARKQFGGQFEYVFVLHAPETDPSKKKADHPHVHLTVRSTGLQGQRLNPDKEDLQRWRENFALELGRVGIRASATPRRTRGVVAKGSPGATARMGKRSRFNQWRVNKAIETLQGAGEGGGEKADEPWRAPLADRQKAIRRSWGVLAYALELEGHGTLANQVRDFVRQMPSPYKTSQDLLVDNMRVNLDLLRASQASLKPALDDPAQRR